MIVVVETIAVAVIVFVFVDAAEAGL